MENREVRLIDANKLKLVYEDWIAKMEDCPIDVCADECQAIYDCIWELNEAPTIDPESLRPHGKWFECDYVEYDGHSECIHYPKAALGCTNCRNAFKKEFLWKRNYCPNCGAVMQGVKDE